jgi:hypothetical protein
MLVHKQPDVTQRSDLSVPVVEMIVCRYGNPGLCLTLFSRPWTVYPVVVQVLI